MKHKPELSSEDWWSALAQSELLLLKCQLCGASWIPFMRVCPECGYDDARVIKASGRGFIYSWVVIHRSVTHPEDTPFAIAQVQLAEGPRLDGRIACEGVDLQAGLPVHAIFEKRDGLVVVGFSIDDLSDAS
jgi:uncharacterized OB-fold protein